MARIFASARNFQPAFIIISGSLFPSLGDFCINILYATWFVTFVFRHRDKVLTHVYNKFIGYIIVIALYSAAGY